MSSTLSTVLYCIFVTRPEDPELPELWDAVDDLIMGANPDYYHEKFEEANKLVANGELVAVRELQVSFPFDHVRKMFEPGYTNADVQTGSPG